MEAPQVICYDIRSYFKESPPLSCCPLCATQLQTTSLPPSAPGIEFRQKATIPLLETTLYSCTACGWWAIRELRVECELIDGVSDYLVTLNIMRKQMKPLPSSNPADVHNPTWQEVIRDARYWQPCQAVSPQIARLLFGQAGPVQRADKSYSIPLA